MTDNTNQLLCCPFCGSPAKIEGDEGIGFASCSNSECEISIVVMSIDEWQNRKPVKFDSFVAGKLTPHKIWFANEKRPYGVRAIGRRYIVCTKPFNIGHTTIYTIVDMIGGVRGTENLIFGAGAETDTDCEEMLLRLETGESEISHRNCVILDITKIEFKKDCKNEV